MTEASGDSDDEGGRVFFARPRRAPDRDTEIVLISVGVDIGSATTHLVFSRLVLLRRGPRTTLRSADVVHDSDILLTPYAEGETIDVDSHPTRSRRGYHPRRRCDRHRRKIPIFPQVPTGGKPIRIERKLRPKFGLTGRAF